MQVEFEAVYGLKFMTFWDDVRDPLWLSSHLTDCLYRVSFRRYRPLKLLLGCKVGPKRWFLGPRFVEGGDTPDFGQAFSNCTYFRACAQFSLTSVQRARRSDGEKKKKKERKKESVVKYKAADIVCWAA